jgi:NADPH:quinone reductase-like Zn-dependent oxidoreductase
MQAIVYHRYGPPDVLQLAEIEVPTPAENQVLIRVRNASVNPYDWHFLLGTPSVFRLFVGILRPKSPRLGADLSGEVESVGSKVTRFRPGDYVFGTGQGAFAQYACVPQDQLALKPASISFEQAASLPIASLTAMQGLRDSARLQPSQYLLVNGAAGGVGTFAVQIAKQMGAHVTGVCSTRNVDLVRSLGADDIIDYTREDFTQSGCRYDAIFDLVGNRSLSDLRRVLEPRGVLVPCGGGGPERTSFEILAPMLGQFVAAYFIPQRIAGLLAKVNTQDLQHVAALVEAGSINPFLDRIYPLAETANAIRYVEQGHARGKVVIAIS